MNCNIWKNFDNIALFNLWSFKVINELSQDDAPEQN